MHESGERVIETSHEKVFLYLFFENFMILNAKGKVQPHLRAENEFFFPAPSADSPECISKDYISDVHTYTRTPLYLHMYGRFEGLHSLGGIGGRQGAAAAIRFGSCSSALTPARQKEERCLWKYV